MTNTHILSHLAQFFLEWKIFRTKVVEEIKTHILGPISFLDNRDVYEIIYKKNLVELDSNMGHTHWPLDT